MDLSHPHRDLVALLPVLAVLLVLLTACAGADEDAEETPTAAEQPTQAEAEVEAEVEVTIPAAGVELEGTLWLPDADGPSTGVVIAHGSGPLSRRGELPGQLGLTFPAPVPVYEELASGLRDAGAAVLTFDKRSCGPFNGCADNSYPQPPEDLTFTAFVDDLAAVVDHLGARDDVDEVVVLGHSKGGTVATQLLAGGADLAGIALLATPVVGVPELLATQAATLAELVAAAGQTGPQAQQAVGELEALAQQVAEVADGAVDGPAIAGTSRAFWASWIAAAEDAPQVLVGTEVPVLVLGGGRDWNVPADQVTAWQAVVDRAEVVVLDDVTHALTRLVQDDPAAITPGDVGTQLAPEVLDALTAWLDALTS